MSPRTRLGLGDRIVQRLEQRARGLQVRALLDLAGGDEQRLAMALWRLSVAGRAHFTCADGMTPEMAYPGPCHAVAARFASTCPWCADRLADSRTGGAP